MNTNKYYSGNVGLLSENDRSLYEREKEDGTVCYDSTSRSAIDFAKTHLNYNLCEHSQYNEEELIAIHEHIRNKKMRKDGVLFGQTIITLPKDYDGDPDEFFKHAYNGLKKFYKLQEQDIVAAWVHKDETTMHMHFSFLPVFRDKDKDGKDRITMSWEHMFPKALYESQHQKLEVYLQNKMPDATINLLNGETLGFDVQSLTPEQKAISLEIYSLKTSRNDIYDQLADLEYKKAHLEHEIEYYASDEHKVNELAIEWEHCNAKISEKANQKKIVMNELDAKIVEFADNKRQTSQQRAIIELIADKTNLENKLMVQAEQCSQLQIQNHNLQKEIGYLRHMLQELQKNMKDFASSIPNFVRESINYFTENKGKIMIYLDSFQNKMNPLKKKSTEQLMRKAEYDYESAARAIENTTSMSTDMNDVYSDQKKILNDINTAMKAGKALISGAIADFSDAKDLLKDLEEDDDLEY